MQPATLHLAKPRPFWCQYCNKPAEIFDIDGCWCTPECQRHDRQSEITVWRRAVNP